MRIEVRSLATGYYGHKRRKPGERFYIEPDALKFAKVLNAKGDVVEQVILPTWVQAIGKVPAQSELRKALIEFQQKRKASKLKAPVYSEPVPEELSSEDKGPEKGANEDVI